MCMLSDMAKPPAKVIASADLPHKISEELLVCKICYGRFSVEKLPKLLHCSHTFCEPCVKQFFTAASSGPNPSCESNVHTSSTSTDAGSHGQNKENLTPDAGVRNGIVHLHHVEARPSSPVPCSQPFLCPLCRKQTKLPENGLEGLANNFTVLTLMEILEKQTLTSSLGPQYVDFSDLARDDCSVSAGINRTTRLGSLPNSPPDGRRVNVNISSPPRQHIVRFVTDHCVSCARDKELFLLSCGHKVCKPCSDAARLLHDLGRALHDEKMEEEDDSPEPSKASADSRQASNDNNVPGPDNEEITANEPLLAGQGALGADTQVNSADKKPLPPSNKHANTTTTQCGSPKNSSHTVGQGEDLHTITEEDDSMIPLDQLPPKQSHIRDNKVIFCPVCERYMDVKDSDVSFKEPGDGESKHGEESLEGDKTRSCCSGGVDDGRPPPFNPGYAHGHNPSMSSMHMSANVGATTLPRAGSVEPWSPARLRSNHSSSALYSHSFGSLQGQNVDYTHYDIPCPPYEIPGELPQYESAYSVNACHDSVLPRIHSFRRPPVPPRRSFPSSPGSRSSFRLERRSYSCPMHPSEPGNTKQGNPTYQSRTSIYGSTMSPGPVPPPRRIYDSPHSSPVKCVKKFGKYSEVRMQTSTFQHPTSVAVSDGGDIVVVDTQMMTVQIFNLAGDYLSMFKVIGVQGACFLSVDRLAVATHRGVEIYTMAGERLKDLAQTQGLAIRTTPYKFGFIACMPKGVAIYRQSLTLHKELVKRKTGKSNLFCKKYSGFDNLKDVSVLTSKHIVVLDSGSGTVIVLEEDGHTKMIVDPTNESCGKLKNPEAVCVDRANNILVSDTGNQRVLKFSNNGAFSKCVLSFKTSASEKQIYPRGIAVTDHGNLIVVISGNQIAEVRIYIMMQ